MRSQLISRLRPGAFWDGGGPPETGGGGAPPEPGAPPGTAGRTFSEDP